MTGKQRIWELDALRGICVLGMVAVHFVYDLVELYALVDWQYPALFAFVKDWGGVLFLLISGICVTLGSRSVRRGLIVLACGALVSAVTAGMYLLNLADRSILIYFGVLHCLGLCMILWPLFRRLPPWALAAAGAVLVAAGLYLRGIRVDFPWLVFLGFTPEGFPRIISPCCPTWASSCWALSWAGRSTKADNLCCPGSTPKTPACGSSASAAGSRC